MLGAAAPGGAPGDEGVIGPCAQTGAATAMTATSATPLKRCFIFEPPDPEPGNAEPAN